MTSGSFPGPIRVEEGEGKAQPPASSPSRSHDRRVIRSTARIADRTVAIVTPLPGFRRTAKVGGCDKLEQ